jgi:hypothetical protein
MFSKLLNKNETKIIPIKTINNSPSCWGGNGIVFYVQNGKGLIREKHGSYGEQGLSTLVYDDIPLTKFHGDEYLCPTCEKLISAGYGLDKVDENVILKLRKTLNESFAFIDESLKDLEPILGLLPTGYYGIADIELYPTDGCGNFFWKTGNIPVVNRAASPIYEVYNFEYADPYPKYIAPTQPPKLFNKDRVEFYRGKDSHRAIAYYLDGYLCALLDGHHKAVAAAIDKKPLRSLVILPTTSKWYLDRRWNNLGGIIISGLELQKRELTYSIKDAEKQMYGKQMSPDEVQRYLRLQDESFGSYKWSEDILECEEYFPVVDILASKDLAGDISDERLDKIINKEEKYDYGVLYHIINALFFIKSPRFKEIAFFVCNNEKYLPIWEAVFSLLAKIKDEEVETFFLEYLINDEKLRPYITKIVDDYFREIYS